LYNNAKYSTSIVAWVNRNEFKTSSPKYSGKKKELENCQPLSPSFLPALFSVVSPVAARQREKNYGF
jgi:hypothetical protein